MKPVRDKTYLAWVRSLPCTVAGCRRGPVEAHHVGKHGMGQKPSDHETVPLCRFHHQQYHAKGWVWFDTHHGLELRAVARRLWQEYFGNAAA